MISNIYNLDHQYFTKSHIGLLSFLLFCYVTERAELFPPPHLGGKIHHFMTCYKMCAFHCKLGGEKSVGGSQTSRTDLLSHGTSQTCLIGFHSWALQRAAPLWLTKHTHPVVLSSDKSSNAASFFICFALWPSHNQLTYTHSDRNM